MHVLSWVLGIAIVLLVGGLMLGTRGAASNERRRRITFGSVGIVVLATLLIMTLGMKVWLAAILGAVSIILCLAPRRSTDR